MCLISFHQYGENKISYAPNGTQIIDRLKYRCCHYFIQKLTLPNAFKIFFVLTCRCLNMQIYLASKNQRVIQCTSRLDTPNEGDASSWQNRISVLEGMGA